MSLYTVPQVIRVKRRKTDESADIFYLEHKSKRKRIDEAHLFQRIADDAASSALKEHQPAPPPLRERGPVAGKPRARSRLRNAPPPIKCTLPPTLTAGAAAATATTAAAAAAAPAPSEKEDPLPSPSIHTFKHRILQKAIPSRHLHLSAAADQAAPKTRKRKVSLGDTAIFVHSRPPPSLRSSTLGEVPVRTHAGLSLHIEADSAWDKQAVPEPTAPLKRPNVAARTRPAKTPPADARQEQADKPSPPDPNPDSTNMASLFLSLLHDVERESERKGIMPTAARPPRPTPAPRAPAQRIQDRTKPQSTPQPPPLTHAPLPVPLVMQEAESDNEAEYVYDTYIRIAPEEASKAVERSGTAAVAVIDEEDEHAWDQFLEHVGEELDEDGEPSDEDDENAENYYAADYPDEEMDSDDERGVGAYNFRTAASDEEEYDFYASDEPVEQSGSDSSFRPGRFVYPRGLHLGPGIGRSRSQSDSDGGFF